MRENIFICERIPDILLYELTKAELEIYIEIKKISQEQNNEYVSATIDYLSKHTEYNSKSFISKTLARLTDKGLLIRNLVQSNKSRHKCYQYYLVQDLRLTKLYQELPEDKKKRYTLRVDEMEI